MPGCARLLLLLLLLVRVTEVERCTLPVGRLTLEVEGSPLEVEGPALEVERFRVVAAHWGWGPGVVCRVGCVGSVWARRMGVAAAAASQSSRCRGSGRPPKYVSLLSACDHTFGRRTGKLAMGKKSDPPIPAIHTLICNMPPHVHGKHGGKEQTLQMCSRNQKARKARKALPPC